jgi:hypothetical protein
MMNGALLVGLYILSDIAKSPACGYLALGLGLFVLGVVMWWKDPAPPPQPSGRFRILKMGQKKQAVQKK